MGRASVRFGPAALAACAVAIFGIDSAICSSVPQPGPPGSMGSIPQAGAVTVPGHFANFKEAIDKGTGGQGTCIVVHPGEHRSACLLTNFCLQAQAPSAPCFVVPFFTLAAQGR